MQRFSYGNPIPAGEYLADVYVNNELRGRITLQFVELLIKNLSDFVLHQRC
ncbi:FimD/PapC N-terminal domain-containing protein [Gallibacterium anatis]|uniref:FimD/PapC N-terminal domain-containing protein n=1 Tax=Gallibacterium anatis TaxID=750 RepID=UPI00227865B6|nr:FimD/PapC N-terminal domain-containing protein [Gallibacterium anatis]